MSRYIPCEKMKAIREAAKNGDEIAQKILRAQLSDDEDFSSDLDAFFAPKEEPKPVEEVATAPIEEVKQEETQETENLQQEKPVPVLTGQEVSKSEISQKILDLISACDKQTLDVANDGELSEATKKGALSILGEIKQSCLENLEKFGKLMSSISKKVVDEE